MLSFSLTDTTNDGPLEKLLKSNQKEKLTLLNDKETKNFLMMDGRHPKCRPLRKTNISDVSSYLTDDFNNKITEKPKVSNVRP